MLVSSSQCPYCYSQTTRSDSQIQQQISVLNSDYAGTGLTFTLAGTTHTTNSQWFNQVGPDSSLQTTMKNQLRQGGANALNLYSVGYVANIPL